MVKGKLLELGCGLGRGLKVAQPARALEKAARGLATIVHGGDAQLLGASVDDGAGGGG